MGSEFGQWREWNHDANFDRHLLQYAAQQGVQRVIAFIRSGERPEHSILVVCNLTPAPRLNYRVGVRRVGRWREILNSDAQPYGGGYRNLGDVEAAPVPEHGRYHSLFDSATTRCTLP